MLVSTLYLDFFPLAVLDIERDGVRVLGYLSRFVEEIEIGRGISNRYGLGGIRNLGYASSRHLTASLGVTEDGNIIVRSLHMGREALIKLSRPLHEIFGLTSDEAREVGLLPSGAGVPSTRHVHRLRFRFSYAYYDYGISGIDPMFLARVSEDIGPGAVWVSRDRVAAIHLGMRIGVVMERDANRLHIVGHGSPTTLIESARRLLEAKRWTFVKGHLVVIWLETLRIAMFKDSVSKEEDAHIAVAYAETAINALTRLGMNVPRDLLEALRTLNMYLYTIG